LQPSKKKCAQRSIIEKKSEPASSYKKKKKMPIGEREVPLTLRGKERDGRKGNLERFFRKGGVRHGKGGKVSPERREGCPLQRLSLSPLHEEITQGKK